MKTAGMIGAGVLAAVLFCGCNHKAGVTKSQSSIWQADYNAAQEQAAAENKYMLVNISGMQWCHYCQALDREVFSQPEFIEYATNNLICVQLDFDFSGRATNQEFAEPHEALLARFMVEGFPTVIILNPQGRAVARDGYRPDGPAAYVGMIKDVIAANPVK